MITSWPLWLSCTNCRERLSINTLPHLRVPSWLGPAVIIPVLFIFRPTGENVTTDEAEAAAMLSIATNKYHQDALPPISTFDLRDSLQVNDLFFRGFEKVTTATFRNSRALLMISKLTTGINLFRLLIYETLFK